MNHKKFPCSEFEEIVYLFQGGGALGAFQVGVFQALEEAGFAPDWIAGISIGSINSAIIAGNPPDKRLEKLYEFWDKITHHIDPQLTRHNLTNQNIIQAYNACSAMYALNYGQKGFFSPSNINPWLINKAQPDEISFYDTSLLRNTLEEVIDFDYLNAAHTRLSLGAVNIESGKLKFFDNTRKKLSVDHIMASCALPPGFPAIKIDENYYWDGGLYSNTPLICIINEVPHKNRLCFLVDLFDSTGMLPHTLDEVLERAKDITYAGHLDLMLDFYDAHLLMQKKISDCLKNLAPKLLHDDYIQELSSMGDAHNVHITKIVYKAHMHDLHSKDYEFSNFSARRRLVEGYTHTKKLLSNPNWWQTSNNNLGTLVHPTPEDMHIVIGSCTCKDIDLYNDQ